MTFNPPPYRYRRSQRRRRLADFDETVEDLPPGEFVEEVAGVVADALGCAPGNLHALQRDRS
jgi:hypothetical protein